MSSRLKLLGERLFLLRLIYLPDDARLDQILDYTTDLTAIEIEMSRAFCVMAHAEIEAFFEELALKKARLAFHKWDAARKSSKCLMFIMLSYGFEMNLEKRSLPKARDENGQKKSQFDVLMEASGRVLKSFESTVEANHGIKEKHLRSLFGTLGFDLSKMDPILFGHLNSWADDRGRHAHGRPIPFNPTDELTRVREIFLALNKFENQVNRL